MPLSNNFGAFLSITLQHLTTRTPLPAPLASVQDVFGGAKGPVADALNLNAGVALAAATVAADAKDGVAMAQEAQRRCAWLNACVYVVMNGHASTCFRANEESSSAATRGYVGQLPFASWVLSCWCVARNPAPSLAQLLLASAWC